MTLPPPRSERARAIVLVHGAWVGEWCWSPVLAPLRETGRPVYAVSLTGHGTRARASSNHIELADHVADVVAVLDVHDLVEVTLVGHSYGGRVITEVWRQRRARIAKMVYLDAHAPIGDDRDQPPERVAIAATYDGYFPFAEAGYDPDEALLGGPDGVRWFLDRVMPQSFLTFLEPLGPELPDAVDKTYLFCTGYAPSVFAPYAAAAAVHPAWHYVEVDASHWVMFSHPDDVVTAII